MGYYLINSGDYDTNGKDMKDKTIFSSIPVHLYMALLSSVMSSPKQMIIQLIN